MRHMALGALGAAGIVFLAAAASADGHGETANSASDGASVSIPAEDVVKARRAAFYLSTQAIGQIKGGIGEGGDLRRTIGGAKILANWAKRLPTMFPEGTDLDSSRALSSVWTDREGFEARAEAYRLAAEEVAVAAETGDREATNAAFMAMAGTCKACHTEYREE